VVGLLLLVVPLYEYFRFSPVYNPTECGDQVATVDNTGLFIRVKCWNPNPYHIQILTSKRGKAYLRLPGGQLNHFGDLEVIPGSQLPEQGAGHVRIRIDTQLPTLLTFLADRETPLFMELEFDVGVQISFGLFGVLQPVFQTSAPFKKACGLNIRMGRPGPLLCRDSFVGMEPPHVLPKVPELEEPEVSDEVAHAIHGERMRFTADQVDPDQIAAGEQIKNIGMLLLGVPTCILGLVLTLGLLDSKLVGTANSDSLASSPSKEAALAAGGGTPMGMMGCGSKAYRMLYATVASPSPNKLERGFSIESSASSISQTMDNLIRFVSCGRRADSGMVDPLASPASSAPWRGCGGGAPVSRRLFMAPSPCKTVSRSSEGDEGMRMPDLPATLRAVAAAAGGSST